MSIVNTPMGPNSFQFDYSTGTTILEIFTALEAEIINGHGWELWDSNAGVNQRCYRAKNKDDVTYKYVVMDFSVANVLKLKVYENWDETLHTGTNMCSGSDTPTNCGSTTSLQPGQIYLFVNPRWLAITTRNPFNGMLNSDASRQGIFGCFEFTRDNPEDNGVDGTPCFMWMNTSFLFYGDGCGFSPKFKNGAVGAAAKVEVSTILGKTRDAAYKMLHFTPSTKNPWNEKDWALTMYMHEPNFVMRGRIFGLKLTTYNAYLILDRIISKCDTDFMYDEDGVDTEHHIVNCSHAFTGTSGRVIIPI